MLSHEGVLRVEAGKIIARKYGSVRSLADAAGLNHGTVSRVLRGENKSEKSQMKIAKALGVSRVKLFGKAA